MLRFLADENFKNGILRTLRQQYPHVDVLRVQDAGLRSADDPAILAFGAEQGRLVLTHDVQTMTMFAHERVSNGLRMQGLCLVNDEATFATSAESIAILDGCSLPDEWEGRFAYLPLRTSVIK